MLLSTTVYADEVVSLKSDINILKCQDSCLTSVREGKPIQITLRQTHDESMVSRGEYTLEKSLDDYTFSGSIIVNKFTTEKDTKYLIQAYLLSTKAGHSENQSLGNVVVNNLSNLNSITWKGTLENNDDKYIVSVVIGSSDTLSVK